uniref:Cytosolic carboxypeptidase N-terminal domain-containing protein n=1 Tax=Oryctolagus cuniculus TaxID=9986 RepID=A0A5F9C712_RABIT
MMLSIFNHLYIFLYELDVKFLVIYKNISCHIYYINIFIYIYIYICVYIYILSINPFCFILLRDRVKRRESICYLLAHSPKPVIAGAGLGPNPRTQSSSPMFSRVSISRKLKTGSRAGIELRYSIVEGNLGRVDQVSEFEYDLFIRPDTCNPRFRVWFNFTVENVRESQVRNIMGCVKCGFGKKNMLLFSLRKIKIMAVLVIYSCYLLPMVVLFQ